MNKNMNILLLRTFSLIIIISLYNIGESAVADIDQVLDASDNPKNYRTIFQIARGAQKRYRDLEQIFLRLERILIQDRNNDPTLQPRAEIAIEELRNIWLSLKPLMAISDLAFTKSTKISSIAAQRTSANNARTSLQVNIADSTFSDLEFAYKRWRQFFLENDFQNSPNRDERRAYAALNRNFALLIPLVRDHQSKGADEVQRILDAPNSQEILFDPNQPMDTGSKLLELEKNFARSKAFTDQTKYKVTLDATTSPTADDAQKADESLDAAYSILVTNEINALGMANQKDPSKLAKAIFETFFLRLRDENKYTLAEIRRANDEMAAIIGQNGRGDEKAEMIIREAYFRAKLDASDFFDPSVNNPALGQFQNTLSNFIDQIFNLLNFDLANDYSQILDFKPGDDVEAKFKAKDAEFRQIRKEIRNFQINDQRAFVDLVTDCLDAIENARDKLAAQFPSPPNTGTGTGSGTGGANGGGGSGGSSNPSNPAPPPQPSAPAQPPPPMPTPQPSSPSAGTSPVMDKATNCQQMKRLCNNRLYEGLMKTHCAKTCKDAGVQCADSRPNCGTWRRNGFCISAFYKDETKKELCSLTCGLC